MNAQPWSCPACGREFAHRRAHTCAPALSVDQYFARRPDWEREIYELVRAHLEALGPVIVEPVNVGIFFKGRRNFVELRPKTRWLDVTFGLNRTLSHPRISRTMKSNGSRTYHAVRLTSAADVDPQLLDWLTESYVTLATQP
jgi:hypothetical protein